MRSIIIAAAAALVSSSAFGAVFAGNGGGGFGGSVGNGSMTVTPGATSVTFSFTPSGSFGGNDLAIYLDTKAGGISDNSTLTDTSNEAHTAISGLSGSGRALVTFPAGFGADVALNLKQDYFEAQNISNPSSFVYINGGPQPGGGPGPFSQTFSYSDLGITPGTTVSFVATLISGSGYRSNETIGTSVTLADAINNPGSAPNAGFTGTQVFTSANSFVAPEPTTLVAFAGVGLAALRRRK